MSDEGVPEDVVRFDADDAPGEEGLDVSHDVLELDHVYEALDHPRRRYLCHTLLEHDERSLSELARTVAAWEEDVPEDEVSEAETERVCVSLYHAHAPKLADCGVVSFDAEAETLSTAENAEHVQAALDALGASVEASQEHHGSERTDADEG
jgi:hypothetical protein